MNILRVLDPIALQRAEIITVAQFAKQLLEDGPIPLAASNSELTIEVAFDVVLNAVVVEQRIVHVDQKNNWARGHDATSAISLVSGLRSAVRFELLVRSRSD